jgi:hypothetical protein
VLQAVSMRKHLELNRKDKDGKFRLILVESRIHRLARYYRVRAVVCLQFISCAMLYAVPHHAMWLCLSHSSLSSWLLCL